MMTLILIKWADMRWNFGWFCLGAVMMLGGCQQDKSTAGMDEALRGVWEQRGYGRWIEIRAEGFVIYAVTEHYCVEEFAGDAEDWEVIVPKSEVASDVLVLERTQSSVYRLDRRESLVSRCLEAPLNTPTHNFEMVWELFHEQYAFFEARNVDWRKQYERYAPLIDDAMDAERWFEALTQMLEPLHDAHVMLSHPQKALAYSGKIVPQFLSEIIEACQALSAPDACIAEQLQELLESTYGYLEGVETTLEGALSYATIAGHPKIAYFNLLAMEGYEAPDQPLVDALNLLNPNDGALVDAFMRDWLKANPEVETLILDLRFNQGGEDQIGLKWASWLVNTSKAVMQKHARYGTSTTQTITLRVEAQTEAFKGKIIVLTSKATVSAAETFLLALRQYEKVRVIGEPTQGTFSDMLIRTLPNGFVVTLSNEIYSDMSGTVYEVQGIPVDVAMENYTPQERLEGKDAVLERAIALAQERF